jgi:hypothetical protein
MTSIQNLNGKNHIKQSQSSRMVKFSTRRSSLKDANAAAAQVEWLRNNLKETIC